MFWDARISALLCRLMDPGRQGRIRYLPVSTESVRSYVTGVDVAAVEAVVLADGSRAASRSVVRPGRADSKVRAVGSRDSLRSQRDRPPLQHRGGRAQSRH